MPISHQKGYNNEYARYWVKPILEINSKYYIICSEWYPQFREKLEKWISENPIPNLLEESNPKTDIFILPKNKIKICGKCGNKTQMNKLLVTYYKGDEDFQHMLHIRKCNNCSLIYMSEGTLKMYKDTSDKLDDSINFIKKDT